MRLEQRIENKGKITNSKSQITNKFQIPIYKQYTNYNIQIPNSKF